MRFFDATGNRMDPTPWTRRVKVLWEIPRSTLITLVICVFLLCTAAVTQINLTTQVQGVLPVANGGSGAATFAAHTWLGNNTASTVAPSASALGASDFTPAQYAAGGGTAQAQTVTLSPAATALTAGLNVMWKPTAANTAGGPTLAVNGLTATAITKCGATALIVGDLSTTAVAEVVYDGTQFQLINPQVTPCGTLLTGTFADNETPTGTCPTTSLSLAHTPSPAASLSLYYNGQLLVSGGADYSLATATITLTNSCPSGTVFRANYRY
jgi:hypothetical protein